MEVGLLGVPPLLVLLDAGTVVGVEFAAEVIAEVTVEVEKCDI